MCLFCYGSLGSLPSSPLYAVILTIYIQIPRKMSHQTCNP
ncbi:Protein of unknown function [Pyronema omphalodes CBS 100304]|uniref:Uncharacterized protein n=1 Tax=Pyronema omphalodes (strain CBS 100304) TaxID=1076935 RepID=U4LA46_PYROM|nr:Protein of unknown function [Pyronema omphalodes CBS 100304]